MKKCLIVVDYQNDFVDGALGFSNASLLEPIIVDKIRHYLKIGGDLIFTFDTHDENYLNTREGKMLPILHCIKGHDGHQLYGLVSNYLTYATKIFYKKTFGSIDLGNYLKNQNYEQIELCGLVTNMCVLSNAVIAKSALPNAHIIIDHKAVMSFDLDLHHQTLSVLKGIHIDII